MKNYSRYRIIIATLFVLVDVIVLNLLYFSTLFYFKLEFSETIYSLVWLLTNLVFGLSFILVPIDFDNLHRVQISYLFKRNFLQLTFTLLVLLSSIFFLRVENPLSRIFAVSFLFAACTLLTIVQFLTRQGMYFAIKQSFSKGIILGSGNLSNMLFDEVLSNIYNGVIILGFFDDNADPKNKDISGGIEAAKSFIIKNRVSDVFCTLPLTEQEKIKDFIKFSERHVLNFHIVPDIGYYYQGNLPITVQIGQMPIFLLHHIPLTYVHNALIKRIFDFIVSLLAIILIFPIFYPLFGILIKLSSPGPVFFKQKRTGFKGREFNCYKFRTMQSSAEAHTKQATRNDSRITEIGKFLRKTSIDELPQLFNVLIGDMSLVGPRPHMLSHTDTYSPKVDKYMIRHFIYPGITGLAQVNGCRGETKEVEQMEKRIRYDVEYVEKWSLGLDIKIIFQTIIHLLKGDNQAY